MPAETKPGAARSNASNLFYSAASLRFARDIVFTVEVEMKERALELAVADGRNLVTVEDMKQAAREFFADGVIPEADGRDPVDD